ncbi:MAG TPA: cellulase family glycosylhydrolase, partial [Acidimicrobiales bacterium]|nr:cellulase family glycosylhydrolase [Acidimicrobiales bacterium]
RHGGPDRGGPGHGGAGAGGAPGGAPGAGGLWTNLLSTAQSLFNGSTASWSGVGSHLSWVASPALGPAGALRVTSTGTQAMWALSGSPTAGGLSPAAPGSVYAGEAEVRSAAGVLTVQPVIGFYDAAGDYLTSVWGQGTQAGAGSWAPVTAAVAQAPARTAFVGLGVLVYATQPGQAIYLVSPGLLRNAGPSVPAVVGPLQVRGNQVVAADGRPVVLRGTELYGLDSSSSPASVTASAVAAARAWGANVVRVALGEQLWLPTSCAYDPGYAAAVDRAVDWITTAGMVAVLELQDSIVSPGCPAGGPHDMADNPGSLVFWSQVASRYASNPLVAFDLYNEPHDISDAVWLSGGLVTDTATGAVYEAAGMQQLYDAVRSTGAQNLVLVSGNNWANTVPSAPVQGTNVVDAVHAYTCPNQPPPSCATPDPADPTRILSQWVGVGASHPVMVSEFGWPSTGDGTYMANVIAYAAAHGWGWSAFAWDATAPFGLLSTDPSSATAEPAPSGMPVLAALANAVGPG